MAVEEHPQCRSQENAGPPRVFLHPRGRPDATRQGWERSAEHGLHGLTLVRHARPLMAPGICYGASDIPADAVATEVCAHDLARQLPVGTRVFASPLQRCGQLAQALQRLRPELVVTVDPRLSEMDFGHWEGWRWADIPKPAIDTWTRNFAHARFGGRESVQQLMDRVAALWALSLAYEQPVTWLTHAGVIRAAILLARNVREVRSAGQWPVEAPGFGQWLAL